LDLLWRTMERLVYFLFEIIIYYTSWPRARHLYVVDRILLGMNCEEYQVLDVMLRSIITLNRIAKASMPPRDVLVPVGQTPHSPASVPLHTPATTPKVHSASTTSPTQHPHLTTPDRPITIKKPISINQIRKYGKRYGYTNFHYGDLDFPTKRDGTTYDDDGERE